MMRNKILIAGGGLAGICIAYQLAEKNIPFILLDKGSNQSSLKAAGLINPIVFRRMLKSWRVDEFLPYALEFYIKIGKYTNADFFHHLPMRRGFAHQQETELWETKQNSEEYRHYLSEISEEDENSNALINNFGTGIVKQTGFVDAKTFLENSYIYFKSLNSYLNTEYKYDEFDLANLTFRGDKFEKIIFCEGYNGIYNPWFNYLPLQPTKGQTIIIKSNEIKSNEILNRKCFVLPLGNNEFKVGATYEWNTTDLSITEEGVSILKNNLKQLISNKYEVIHQDAGIRPTVKDRRPLVGEHPQFKNTFIFNGLGTKGYLMAPLLSKELYEFIFENLPLSQEINISRFNKL
jgi:glycine/D-amino acid oxidase-like deaminating enzyme